MHSSKGTPTHSFQTPSWAVVSVNPPGLAEILQVVTTERYFTLKWMRNGTRSHCVCTSGLTFYLWGQLRKV